MAEILHKDLTGDDLHIPKTHNTSHQVDGSDVVSIEGLLGSPAQKGIANGLATLNASSLVVQNPANATATPTASKISISNQYGLLADGWTKLVVNVKNYGAVGDGTTDDTTAIQNAINSVTEGIIFFPQGKYLITQAINLTSKKLIF